MSGEEGDERIQREKDLCHKYATLFSGGEGREVLLDLRQHCGADHLCFDPNSKTTAFMLGARSVWLYIQERCSAKALERLGLQSDTDKTVKVDTQ